MQRIYGMQRRTGQVFNVSKKQEKIKRELRKISDMNYNFYITKNNL